MNRPGPDDQPIHRAEESFREDGGAPLEGVETAAPTDPVAVDFLQALVRAMRSAADLERARVDGSVAAAIRAQIAKVRSRAVAEADGLRQLADGDIDGIHDWAKAEVARVNKEGARRVGVRRRQLEHHLEQHAALTEREVMSIEAAVDVYRSELEGYFARLTDEPDPTEVARLAGMLPEPPDLEQVADEARAEALDAIAGQSDDSAPTAESGGDPLSAFSPVQAGPGLVAVMAEPGERQPAKALPITVFAGGRRTEMGSQPIGRLRSARKNLPPSNGSTVRATRTDWRSRLQEWRGAEVTARPEAQSRPRPWRALTDEEIEHVRRMSVEMTGRRSPIAQERGRADTSG